MANKKNILVSSFVTVVAVGTIGVSVANANFNPKNQRQTSAHEALKNNDLKTFKEVMGDCPMAQQVDTTKDFEAMTLSYNLRQEGKYKEASEVLQRVGIEHPGHINNYGPQADIRNAIENNDWMEFQEATENKNVGNIINTQEKFDALVEAHELRNDGRSEEADEIIKELGVVGRYM